MVLKDLKEELDPVDIQDHKGPKVIKVINPQVHKVIKVHKVTKVLIEDHKEDLVVGDQ